MAGVEQSRVKAGIFSFNYHDDNTMRARFRRTVNLDELPRGRGPWGNTKKKTCVQYHLGLGQTTVKPAFDVAPAGDDIWLYGFRPGQEEEVLMRSLLFCLLL